MLGYMEVFMATLRVAVDVGGTFTDVIVLDESSAQIRVGKVPSTPDDPGRAVMEAAQSVGVNLADVILFSHGTTVATNALITRRFPPAAMVTTRGFRDVIEIRNGTKDDLWDAYKDVAGPYIRRRDRYEVTERIDFEGNVLVSVNETEAREVAAKLRKKNIQTVAVCFVNSYASGANERRMKEILEEELPNVRISTSSEILPEIFEHDRFNTTVANAVLAPLVGDYVQQLSENLKAEGYAGDLLLLHSGGGSMTTRMVQKYAVRLAASGIAAGAIAARHLASQAGFPNAIGLDMGGTSTDIALVYEGEVRVTKQWAVEYGYPICFPSIEVLTIGAGGGSLAWIDSAGSLRNGPQSAGATPGPAAYGMGGVQPTNTDANVVLNRLGTSLAGGKMHLKADLARTAIEVGVATPFQMSVEDAALSVIKVANANMADAVRLVSIRRGYDPREFALVAFGGAGALHGAALARELSIPTVLVPPNPGVTSALGCLLVDIRHDLAVMYQKSLSEAEPAEMESMYQTMELEAAEHLKHEGVSDEQVVLERTAAMRYLGQWRSLTVTVGTGAAALAEAVERFHREHEREYSFSQIDAPIEIYQLGVRAIGVTPKPDMAATEVIEQSPPAPSAYRDVWFEDVERIGVNAVSTPIYERSSLVPGMGAAGPAVIDQLDSTTLVPPHTRWEIDRNWNILIHIQEISG
jgi:N-methylhydantoinase A